MTHSMRALACDVVMPNTQPGKIVVHVSSQLTFVAVSQPNTRNGWGLVASGAPEAAVRIHECEFVERRRFSLERYFTPEAARCIRQMYGARKPGAPRGERFVFAALMDRLDVVAPGSQPRGAKRVVEQLSAAGIVHTDLNQATNWGRDADGVLRVFDFDEAYSLTNSKRARELNMENAQKRIPSDE